MTFARTPRVFVRHLGIMTTLWLAGAACWHAQAATWYVATNGVNDSAPGRGQSWSMPFLSITYAVTKSSDNDAIGVSNGTYTLAANINASARTITSLYGAASTIINGNGLYCWNITNGTIDGFTISNGAAVNGAGIYVSAADPGVTIQNCIFTYCRATGSGGGMYLAASNGSYCDNVMITNCTFRNNSASGSGAGLYTACNRAVEKNCRFIDNNVCGIHIGCSTNTLVGCVVSNNVGRGIYISLGDSTSQVISNCMIISNYSASWGGGVYIAAAASFLNCTIASNLSTGTGNGGGGMYINSTGSIVSHCLITGNTQTGKQGGGVFMQGGTLVGCLITYNVENTQGGGGVVLNQGASVMRNCTVVSNWAAGWGGGVYVVSAGCGVENSIAYFNMVGGSVGNWTRNGGYFTNTCTTPDVAAYGSGNITNDPQFVSTNTGNFRLSSKNSPCFNKGTNQPWMYGAVDLDGNPRIDPYWGLVDMGAYEYKYVPQGSVVKLR